MEPRIQYSRTSDGVSLAYWSLGSGTPLIWMSPFPFSHVQLEWEDPARRAFFERLAERVTLVRYDSRGIGMSERGALDYSVKAHFRDLEAVADRADLERFGLYAFLHMGPAALAYAVEHRERVSHLMLFCSYASGRDYTQSPQGQAIGALVEKDWETYKDVAALILSRWIAGEHGRRYANLIQESATAEVTRAYMSAVDGYDVTEVLREVSCPVLVLHRQGLRWPPVEIARGLASRIPNARLLMLSGSSAALHLEDTEAVIRAMHEFLGEGEEKAAATPDLPSSMTAILFADIADSTALTERLGDTAFREKARDLDTALRAIIRNKGGTPIEGKLLGDGVLATFTSARQAIEAALACAKAGAQASLPLHLGLHAGDVLREENNVFGGAVNIAARVSSLAAPGEVLVSDIVRGLARTSAGVGFHDRGEQSLKGVGESVRVWSVQEGAT
jgi:class 3 adenylate cyclase